MPSKSIFSAGEYLAFNKSYDVLILTHCVVHTGVEDLEENSLLSAIVIRDNLIECILPLSELERTYPEFSFHFRKETCSTQLLSKYDDYIDSTAEFTGNNDKQLQNHDGELLPRVHVVSLHGLHIAAGFIDLQLNGCGGRVLNSCINKESLDLFTQTSRRCGTTSILPTLISSSDEDIFKAVGVIRQVLEADCISMNQNASFEFTKNSNFAILGIHLEGPHINSLKKGIHNEEFIRPLSSHLFNFYLKNWDVIRIMTVAPEIFFLPEESSVDDDHPGDVVLTLPIESELPTKCLTRNSQSKKARNIARDIGVESLKALSLAGIVLSVGHSNATFKEARLGFDCGIKMCTHLYNAMRLVTSREAGVFGAILYDSKIYASIIVDGVHVAFPNVHMAHSRKKDKLILVTDSLSPAGLIDEDGRYTAENTCKAATCNLRNFSQSSAEQLETRSENNSFVVERDMDGEDVFPIPEKFRESCYPSLSFKLGNKIMHVVKHTVTNDIVGDSCSDEVVDSNFSNTANSSECDSKTNTSDWLGNRKCVDSASALSPLSDSTRDSVSGCISPKNFSTVKCVAADGTLGGSILTMISGVRNLVTHVGIPLDESLRMASLYPARCLGIDSLLGSIEVGKIANLIIFDQHLKVLGSTSGGKLFWNDEI